MFFICEKSYKIWISLISIVFFPKYCSFSTRKFSIKVSSDIHSIGSLQKVHLCVRRVIGMKEEVLQYEWKRRWHERRIMKMRRTNEDCNIQGNTLTDVCSIICPFLRDNSVDLYSGLLNRNEICLFSSVYK